jgi:SAM-dependent methyltransferase
LTDINKQHHKRQTDPYWSVLVGERWRIGRMSDVEVLEAFYQTGFSDAERVDNWLARSGIVPDSDGICAEYGCGVGRVTAWLAQRFRRERAFDISESHLQAAKQRMVRAKHKQY